MSKARKIRRSQPEAIADLLPRVLGEMGLETTSTAIRLLQVWSDALGPEIAPHCACDGVRRGVIHARVRDSAWMQRIQMQKPRILEALAERLGQAPGDLRLRIGPIDPDDPEDPDGRQATWVEPTGDGRKHTRGQP